MNVVRAALAVAGLSMLAACAAPVVESGSSFDSDRAGTSSEVEVSPTSAPAESIEGRSPATETASTAPPSTEATTITATASTTSVVPLSGWDAVDLYLDITVLRGGSAAVSAAVMRDGVVVHEMAAGTRAAQEPVEAGDRFRVASISKTITAITVLRLVEDGVLALDAPIGGIVAEGLGVSPAVGVGDITVRDLLTHRSGFPQYEDLFFRNEVESCPQAAAAGIARPLRAAPGTSFRYSNLNFCVLGLLIEQATGQSYEAVVQRQLLAPLGLSGMRLAGTFDVRPGDVEHRSEAGRNYMEVLDAAGAWIAPASALVTILDSLDLTTPGWKPLRADTVAEMMTITVDPVPPAASAEATGDATGPASPTDPDAPSTTIAPPAVPESGYGMGVMIFGPGSYGHTGTVESTHAMFVHRPDGITWAVAVSGEYPSSTRQLARIMDNALLLGGFVDGTYVTVPPPLEQP